MNSIIVSALVISMSVTVIGVILTITGFNGFVGYIMTHVGSICCLACIFIDNVCIYTCVYCGDGDDDNSGGGGNDNYINIDELYEV
jgi:hypothetical protein